MSESSSLSSTGTAPTPLLPSKPLRLTRSVSCPILRVLSGKNVTTRKLCFSSSSAPVLNNVLPEVLPEIPYIPCFIHEFIYCREISDTCEKLLEAASKK